MKTLRWLLIIPSIGVGYLLAILAAMMSIDVLTRLCPTEQVVSGGCMASWYETAAQTSFALSVAIGAAVFVGLPAAIAPIKKVEVALLAFLIGLCVVVYGCSQIGMSFIPETAGAVLGGGLTCAGVRRWWRRNTP